MPHETIFYRCPRCENMVTLRHKSDATVICCGEPAIELIPNAGDAVGALHLPEVTFVGGYTANAAKVSIGGLPHPMTDEHHLEWIYLQTVQGGQFKYLEAGTVSLVTFALTGKDGYSYCDRPVCMMGTECKFKCKGGFTAYAYCNIHGLWKTQT